MIIIGIFRGFLLSFMAFPSIIFKKAYEQIGSLSDIDNNPLLIIGDLNELSSPDEKLRENLSINKVHQLDIISLIGSSTKIILLG